MTNTKKLYISETIYRQVKTLAQANGITISVLASTLLTKMLGNHKKETQSIVEKLRKEVK